MTIYDIKYRTQQTAPYFFSSSSMKFFGQTMRSFSVKKQSDGRYFISAPMKDKSRGVIMGYTQRYFNPINNELEFS
jgi:hypothetical protein